MRTSSTILAILPALAAAEQAQAPLLDQLKGWFSKASASISSAIPSVPSSNPIAAGAAKIAAVKVNPLTVQNYNQILQPGAATATPGFEEWMVLVTGGNKTCLGRCQTAETAFNESLVLMATSRSPPSYGILDCESQGPLCAAWSAGPPSILHLLLAQPQVDQSAATNMVRTIPLNLTTVNAAEIADIHLQKKYEQVTPYEGFFHPFDGFLAKNGLAIPYGYVLWGISQIPSWAFMILISFASRTMMNRRMPPSGPRPGAPSAPRA